MKTKNIIIALVIVILLGGAGWLYWSFMMGPVTAPVTKPTPTTQPGFQPLDRPGGTNTGTSTASRPTTGGGISSGGNNQPIPMLRLLSDSPVGGYAASTTATTTTVRWVDRGRGNVYEANYISSSVSTLSNTIVPKIFDAIWNKNLTAFVGSLYEDASLTPTTVYADLLRQGTTTKGTTAPYELRGKDIPGTMIGYAASPDKSKIFFLMDESGSGAGYVASFNGQNMTRIFTTPVTQANVSWPTDNAIAITTKGSASYPGFLYFVNPKTGTWSKVVGPALGLSASVSHDGKYVLYSFTGKNSDVMTNIYSVSTGIATEAIVKTLADKCTWGNVRTDVVYCGVPSQQVAGTYPDDWYLGTLSTVDKIWQITAGTGEVHLISNIIDQADRTIDVYRASLDPKDKFLFFMNKNDLSLWSLKL